MIIFKEKNLNNTIKKINKLRKNDFEQIIQNMKLHSGVGVVV